MNNKKGQMGFQLLVPIMLTIGIAGIIGAFFLNVNADIQDDFGQEYCASRTDGNTTYTPASNVCTDGTVNVAITADHSFNATSETGEGVSNITGKVPILGLVGVAFVIIAALIAVAAIVRTKN